MWYTPLEDRVVPSPLHCDLGLVLRYLNMMEASCKEFDRQAHEEKASIIGTPAHYAYLSVDSLTRQVNDAQSAIPVLKNAVTSIGNQMGQDETSS